MSHAIAFSLSLSNRVPSPHADFHPWRFYQIAENTKVIESANHSLLPVADIDADDCKGNARVRRH